MDTGMRHRHARHIEAHPPSRFGTDIFAGMKEITRERIQANWGIYRGESQ